MYVVFPSLINGVVVEIVALMFPFFYQSSPVGVPFFGDQLYPIL